MLTVTESGASADSCCYGLSFLKEDGFGTYLQVGDLRKGVIQTRGLFATTTESGARDVEEGEFKRDNRIDLPEVHGECRYLFNNGEVFEGTARDGVFCGYGTMYDAEGNIFKQGYWSNDMLHGKGKEFYSDGSLLFEGEWKRGLPHNGTKFEKGKEIRIVDGKPQEA